MADSGTHLQREMAENALIRSIYYGKISKEYTERLLERHGDEGSFLLRDSETVQGVYCLCVRHTPFVRTYRVRYSSAGWALQDSTGQSLQCFKTLDRLIENYRRDTGSDIVTTLKHPLDKMQFQGNRSTKVSYDDFVSAEADYMEM